MMCGLIICEMGLKGPQISRSDKRGIICTQDIN